MNIQFIPVTVNEAQDVHALIKDIYHEKIREYYTEEGDKLYLSFISPAALLKRIKEGSVINCVMSGKELIGMFELDEQHLSLLFIKKDQRGKGISRMIMKWIEEYLQMKELARKITVFSSPNSYEVYVKLGFAPTGEQTASKGIAYIPMEYTF